MSVRFGKREDSHPGPLRAGLARSVLSVGRGRFSFFFWDFICGPLFSYWNKVL